VNARLAEETARLARAWARHDAAALGNYLVAGLQDPRLNVQSILGRHFLIERLFGDRFAGLQDQELRFAATLHWLGEVLEASPDPGQIAALRHALASGADDAEGLPVPYHARQTFASLPDIAKGAGVPNYLGDFLAGAASGESRAALWDSALGVFQAFWPLLLNAEPRPCLSVLEPACGSANDYRGFEGCGLARLLDYTGFDLCERNVENARRLFPGARFEVGNVFETGYPDKTFQCCVAHDLFEHLSLEGLEVAVAELCRVTRGTLCLSFFNMHEGEAHIVRPAGDYHWNTLSLPRVRDLFARHRAGVTALHVGSMLKQRFACMTTYYDRACTLVVQL
jgi:SAM-dependent methyltransferase